MDDTLHLEENIMIIVLSQLFYLMAAQIAD